MVTIIPIYRQDFNRTLDRTCEFYDQHSNTDRKQHPTAEVFSLKAIIACVHAYHYTHTIDQRKRLFSN